MFLSATPFIELAELGSVIRLQIRNLADRVGAHVAGWRAHAIKAHAIWREEQRIVEEMNALTDRHLDELGIHRSDIPQIAREAAEATV